MVSGITIEASIDNVHARSEMLSFCSSSVPHNGLLIFSVTNSLYAEHANGLSHICPASLILEREGQRGALCQQYWDKEVYLTVNPKYLGYRGQDWPSENQADLNSNTTQDLRTFF